MTINAIFFAMALLPALLDPSPYAVAFWLIVASVAASNACFHLYAVWMTRTYSPGVVTGALFYLPLAVLGYQLFVATGVASPSVVAQAVVIGPAFTLWSARNHRRRAATRLA